MNMKHLAVAAAVTAMASGSAFAAGNLGLLNPPAASASFSNTVNSGFMDTWTFDLATPSFVAASLTNVQITFSGNETGGILDFAATLNGKDLLLSNFTTVGPPITVSTQVLAGSKQLPTGTTYTLVVTGSGVTGGSASYGGNIVAAPVPEPETYALMLAGLGVVGFVSARRRKS